MMHTMQALEKTSRAPCTLSALIPSTSTDRSVLTEKTSQQRGKGGKNMHHSAHQTPGSAFFNPRLRLIPCPACPLLSPPHTHTPTLHLQPKAMRPGCAWQLATSPATNVFPKHPLPWPYQQIKPPHNPWWSVPLTFFECVNNFWLAGQTLRPGDVCCVCTCATVCICISIYGYVFVLACICLNIFMSLCFFSVFF